MFDLTEIGTGTTGAEGASTLFRPENFTMRYSGFVSISLLALFTLAACGPATVADGTGGEAESRESLHKKAVCPQTIVRCPPGVGLVDSDGDGCARECGNLVVDGGSACTEGDGGADLDGGSACTEVDGGTDLDGGPSPGDDGGTDLDGGSAEEPIDAGVACPPIWVDCPAGKSPVDSNGDGCALECQ